MDAEPDQGGSTAETMTRLGWEVTVDQAADGSDLVIGSVPSRPGPVLVLVGTAEPLLIIQVAKILERKDFAGTLRVVTGAATASTDTVARVAGDAAGVIVVGEGAPAVGAHASGEIRLLVSYSSPGPGAAVAAAARLVLGLSELSEQLTQRYPGPQQRLRVTAVTAGDPADPLALPDPALVAVRADTVADMGHAGLVHLITRLSGQIAQDEESGSGVPTVDVQVTTSLDRPALDQREAAVVLAVAQAHELVTGAAEPPGPLSVAARGWAAAAPTVSYGLDPDGTVDRAAAATVLALAARRFVVLCTESS